MVFQRERPDMRRIAIDCCAAPAQIFIRNGFYGQPMTSEAEQENLKQLALGLALLCVRNTGIETIHSGIEPGSATGNFSDVKVVTPQGEIPWNDVSRISNDEMRAFMRQVVDRLYTCLLRLDDPEFLRRMFRYSRGATRKWDEPQNLEDWFTGKFDGA
jgi:hypothetical protein